MIALLILTGVALGVIGYAIGRSVRPSAEPMPSPSVVATPPDYRDVLDRQRTGVVVVDETGKIEYTNPVARELAGTHVGALVDAALHGHLAAARAGEVSEESLDLFGPPHRVVHVVCHPLDGARAVAFVRDITERRRIDRVRTDFVANVSHELRTPIGALMVLADTLVGTDDAETIDRIVGRMQGEAERAARTIDDLIELSHLESEAEREFEALSIASVVCEAVKRSAELARLTDISVLAPSHLDDTLVLGDRRQLTSALGNLVENAVKYSDPGDVVRVELAVDDGTAVIRVVDEGAGIPRRDLDRIFERFYRVDRARSRDTGGTGLGLSIVRHVVQNHNGELSVESTEGEGSTFVLRLPTVASAASTAFDDMEIA